MPWISPTLEQLRATNRSNVQAQLRSGPMIPNSVLRVMADSNAGLAYLTILYLNWLALQLMPDTAETEWLDRFASIWLTQGRKTATYANAVVTFTGIQYTALAAASLLNGAVDTSTGANITFATEAPATIGNSGPTSVQIIGNTATPASVQSNVDCSISGNVSRSESTRLNSSHWLLSRMPSSA